MANLRVWFGAPKHLCHYTADRIRGWHEKSEDRLAALADSLQLHAGAATKSSKTDCPGLFTPSLRAALHDPAIDLHQVLTAFLFPLMVFNISSITPSLLSIFNHSRKTAVRQLLKVELSSSSGRSWESQFTVAQLSSFLSPGGGHH